MPNPTKHLCELPLVQGNIRAVCNSVIQQKTPCLCNTKSESSRNVIHASYIQLQFFVKCSLNDFRRFPPFRAKILFLASAIRIIVHSDRGHLTIDSLGSIYKLKSHPYLW